MYNPGGGHSHGLPAATKLKKSMIRIMRFKTQTASETITTNNGQTLKTTLVFEEIGGRYADSYCAVMFGETPSLRPGQLVAMDLRFMAHLHDGRYYQDCWINDIAPLD